MLGPTGLAGQRGIRISPFAWTMKSVLGMVSGPTRIEVTSARSLPWIRTSLPPVAGPSGGMIAMAFGTAASPEPPVKVTAPGSTPVPQSELTVRSKVSLVAVTRTGDSTMIVLSSMTEMISTGRTRPGVCVPERATEVAQARFVPMICIDVPPVRGTAEGSTAAMPGAPAQAGKSRIASCSVVVPADVSTVTSTSRPPGGMGEPSKLVTTRRATFVPSVMNSTLCATTPLMVTVGRPVPASKFVPKIVRTVPPLAQVSSGCTEMIEGGWPATPPPGRPTICGEVGSLLEQLRRLTAAARAMAPMRVN